MELQHHQVTEHQRNESMTSENHPLTHLLGQEDKPGSGSYLNLFLPNSTAT